MQAIRVLRAQSRPASPAPAIVANGDSNNSANEENANGANKTANPITRIQNLSLTSFAKRGATPPPSPSPSVTPAAIAIVQDGTYLNTLGMKLNEAATRCLAMPIVSNGALGGADIWRGKRPIPAGRGRQFALLIETELDASQGNANLRHAILRLLPRSLHVLVSNISTQLSQLLTSPSYIPSNPHVPLHATTLHALALAQLCAEILETFNTYKLGNTNSDLAVIRSHFDTIVTRVTAPLFGQLQMEMNSMLEPVGHASTVTSSPSKELVGGVNKAMNKVHPAIMTLAQNVPVVGRALRRYTFDSCVSTQTSLATLLINTLWQSMVQLSHRQPTIVESNSTLNNVSHKSSFHSLAQVLTPPGSPALKMMKLSPPASPPVKASKKLSPPSSPPTKKRVLALPALTSSPLVNTLALGGSGGDSPTKVKRKSSANSLGSGSANSDQDLKPASRATTISYASSPQPITQASAWLTTLALDTKALVDVLSSNDLPRPVQGSLPREAVDETFDRLLAFRDWLVGAASTGLAKLLVTVPEEVPLLVALPVLLGEAWLEHRSSSNSGDVGGSEFPGMTRVLGYESDEVYRRTVGCGFRRADECENMFAACVVDRLRNVHWAGRVVGWLDVRMGCE